MINSEMSRMIIKLDVEIATLEAQVSQLQERRDLLKAAEVVRKSILWQIEQALEALNQVSPNQIAIFKSEIDAKFALMTSPEYIKPVVVPNACPTSSNKSDKTLAAMFGERIKEYQQFVVIQKELAAIGIKLSTPIVSQDDIKSWQLDWDGNKTAGLFWSVCNGWEIEVLKNKEGKANGNWEGLESFNLMEYLNRNGLI